MFERLCHLSVVLFKVAGAGLVLVVGGRHHGVLASSDTRARAADELQRRTNEGPCLDAVCDGHAVTAADMAGVDGSRWPLYSPGALEAGVRAEIAAPVRMGGVPVGALTLLDDRPRRLEPSQIRLVGLIADSAGELLATELDRAPAATQALLELVGGDVARLARAAGTLSAQHGENIEAAYRRIRRHAVEGGHNIDALVSEILAGRYDHG